MGSFIAGGVPLRQQPLPQIDGRTTPANDDSNREDEQRNASPIDRPSVLESELSKDCFEGDIMITSPVKVLFHLVCVLL